MVVSVRCEVVSTPGDIKKENRASAHLFISVLAYHILHAIEWKLLQHADHRSWKTIRRILSTRRRFTLEFRQKLQEKTEQNFMRTCSKPDPEQKMIYHAPGVKEMPLPGKITRKINSGEKIKIP